MTFVVILIFWYRFQWNSFVYYLLTNVSNGKVLVINSMGNSWICVPIFFVFNWWDQTICSSLCLGLPLETVSRVLCRTELWDKCIVVLRPEAYCCVRVRGWDLCSLSQVSILLKALRNLIEQALYMIGLIALHNNIL